MTQPQTLVIAIDVGNTSVKVMPSDKPATVLRTPIANAGWDENVIEQLRCLSDGVEDVEVRVASVHDVASKRLQQTGTRFLGRHVRWRAISDSEISMPILTALPQKTGIDRLLSAFAAKAIHGSPVVTIDAGTTVTVDLVNERGAFCGGAILPGLAMQTRALAAGTNRLPMIDWRRNEDDAMGKTDRAGRDTTTAIRLGVLSSIVGGIERLLVRYQSAGCVVVTGGDGRRIFDELEITNKVFETELVCRALLNLDNLSDRQECDSVIPNGQSDQRLSS
ncbi:MAG: type III pantothenate kinase [Planctomycetota bacterium]